eukprot:914037-Pelagomonas_calceolata.AAC.4
MLAGMPAARCLKRTSKLQPPRWAAWQPLWLALLAGRAWCSAVVREQQGKSVVNVWDLQACVD